MVEPTVSSQRVTAYRPGPRRGTSNANEDKIASEAARGIVELEGFLAEQSVLACV